MNTSTIKLLSLAAFLTVAGALSAATITWNGNVNSNWTTAGNWSSGSVPTSSDDVVINNGSASNQPVLNGNFTYNSLSISAGELEMLGYTITATTLTFTGGTVK
ncbi:MAG: hypothetical protein JNM67_10520, partial [Bacteroidetes bacterium]|nr:hypothetical protein [Bacteroidota bacterium]